jgi:hypothetical protein
MDRKNFFLGMACIVGAFALFFLTKPATPPPGATPAPSAAVVPVAPALVPKPATTLPASAQSARPVPRESAQPFTLQNDYLEVTLTNRGGAIREIRLKKEFADVTKQSVIVFNAGNDESALALALKNPVTGKLETLLSEFVAQPGRTADTITLVGGLADGTRIERTFTLTAKAGTVAEPYSLGFVTKVIPPAGKPAATVWVSTGCWQPTEGDSANQFLSVLAYDGDDLTRVGLDVFSDSSGFFGLGAHKAQADHAVASVAKPLLWVCLLYTSPSPRDV